MGGGLVERVGKEALRATVSPQEAPGVCEVKKGAQLE